jgi:hypothetical protein
MQHNQLDAACGSRLGFVFSAAVVSLSFSADATFEDIDPTFAELAPTRYRCPVAIDMTLARLQYPW